ncbi:TerC family protein [Paenibacillus sp. N1-5-1-14]|uniref:TerC family protein n=1 Tax=Paenibacillus radicibacter TaxID=2972488 RepID=UPI002159A078|nr:TerC family protein [Paenibacillus radicibacter]MCR8642534.1 TerC family protein [Paenibacillus radicibacter]
MEYELLLLGLLKIVLINIVLSGDNAVVIALACRNLPAEHQKKAIFLGSFGAIALRIILTFAAVWLLDIPFVQVLGGVLLVWIAIKLMLNEEQDENIKSSSNLGSAIKTILFADLIMSLDNVLAVAGAADGNYLLIGLGLAVSIPLIIWGSKLLMMLMERFKFIVILGVALLGYTSGEMIMSDHMIEASMATLPAAFHYVIPVMLAVGVIVAGRMLQKKQRAKSVHAV